MSIPLRNPPNAGPLGDRPLGNRPPGDGALDDGAPGDRPGQQTIVFGRAGNAEAACVFGWSAAEDGYTWTLGPRSALCLSLPLAPHGFDLLIDWQAYLSPGRLAAQRVTLRVGGRHVADHIVQQPETVAFACPAPQPHERQLLIAFDHPDAARPCDLDGHPDDRPLALCLRAIRLVPRAAPRPAAASPAAASPVAPSPAAPSPADTSLPGTALLSPQAQGAGDPAGGAAPLNQLMLGFESLGENCEFGLVQRRCGVEPLGLLRFASAPLPTLLTALRAGFHGLGAPSSLSVERSANGREYMVRDHAFGFYYHAWVAVGDMSPEEISRRESKRLPFLARKLVADLAGGNKIFVYHGMQPLRLADATALQLAVQAYGPATLLWVELADPAHSSGSVEWLGPGLLKGAIDRFAPGDNAHDFALESWVAVCRRAAALHARG